MSELPEHQSSSGPLSGVRVVELGHIVAGPTATLILAELGAEVIKIERPGSGDQARVNKGNQGHFVSYNSNKKSVCLDLSAAPGREALRRMLSRADVLVDNFAPGALDRMGFDAAALASINSRLIHCAIKGFLPGPLGDRPLTDEPAQMRGGLAYMTGPRGRPLRAGTSVVDITGALFAVISILASLLERRDTQLGRQIHVGLFESVVFLMGQHIAKASMSGQIPDPLPDRGMGRDLGWGIYRTFQTVEGRDIFIAVLSDNHWQRFCQEFELDDLWKDPRLKTNTGRAEHHEMLADRTSAIMSSLTFASAIERLNSAGLPVAPVNTPMDLLDDPHLASLKFLEPVHAPDGTPALVAGLPVRTSGWLGGVRSDPPVLGSDTRRVLGAIGLNEDTISILMEQALPEEHGLCP